MKRAKESTMVGQAIETVEGFKDVYKKLHQQVTLRGQSRSTLENYIRRIAQISLQFGKLPEHIKDDEINEYHTALALSSNHPHGAILSMLYMG